MYVYQGCLIKAFKCIFVYHILTIHKKKKKQRNSFVFERVRVRMLKNIFNVHTIHFGLGDFEYYGFVCFCMCVYLKAFSTHFSYTKTIKLIMMSECGGEKF